jgi:5-methylcytosine-specific restriction endonuclease McrA
MNDGGKLGRRGDLEIPGWVSSLPKTERKRLIERVRSGMNVVKATMESGAGLLMDQQLREFFYEYNGRAMRDGPDTLPSSYNWLSPFMVLDKGLQVLRLLPEQDHLFSFSDFVDFATLEGSRLDAYEEAASLPADTILSFNSYEDPHDLRFSADGADFAVGGVSLVRRGSEVTVFLVGGEVADLLATTEEYAGIKTVAAPGKEWLSPASERIRRAEPLKGAADIWKLLAVSRMNIDTRSTVSRSVMRDIGDMYVNVTDDPDTLAESGNSPEQAEVELGRFQVLFEMAKTATLLPGYFKFKYTLVRDEKVTTSLGRVFEQPASVVEKKRARAVPPMDRVLYRKVAALRVVGPSSVPVARRFSAPTYRVEVDGYWRTIAQDSLGRGPAGEAVEGRTWVRGHLRWRDRPARPLQVLVKSRVAIARAIQEGDRLAAEVRATPGDATEIGSPISEVQEPNAPRRVSREEAYKERKRLTSRVRYEILKRDDFRCQRCGADGASDRNVRLDVDHKIAVVFGGKSDPDNLWTLCSRCNNGKGVSL